MLFLRKKQRHRPILTQQAGTDVGITYSVVLTQQITMFKFYAMKILLRWLVSFV